MKKMIFLIPVMCFLGSVSFSQNVGIGTSTPTRAKLEVNGAVDATSAIFGGESSGISLQRNWPGIGFNSYWNAGNRYLANGYGAKHYLDPTTGNMYLDMFSQGTANGLPTLTSRAFTIAPNGYLGLGVASPNAQLQFPNISANRKIVLWESANNDHQFYGLGIESGTMRYNVGGTGDVHKFYAGTGFNSSSLLMSIWGDRTVIIGDNSGGGKLGINQSSPAHTLSIRQAGGTGIYIEEPASGTNWELRAYSISVQNTVLFIRYNNSNVAQIRTNGEYNVLSDKRLKTNIEKMPTVLKKIMQLNPSVYEFKANNPGHEKSMGFIAQEVKVLFPELVNVLEEKPGHGMNELHTMNYSGFGVLAIKGIQEQQLQLNEMKTEIDLLKKQNKLLIELISKK